MGITGLKTGVISTSSLKDISIEIYKTKQVPKLKEQEITKLTQFPLTKETYKTKQVPKTKGISKLIQTPMIKQVPKTKQITKLKQVPKLKTTLKLKQLTKQIITPRFLKQPKPPKTPIELFRFPKIPKLPKQPRGKFPVFVRRFKKWKIIGFGATPLKAFKKRERYSKRTLGRSFYVPGLKPSKLRGFRTKKEKGIGQIYIQKAKSLYGSTLGSRGEKREIKYFRDLNKTFKPKKRRRKKK